MLEGMAIILLGAICVACGAVGFELGTKYTERKWREALAWEKHMVGFYCRVVYRLKVEKAQLKAEVDKLLLERVP